MSVTTGASRYVLAVDLGTSGAKVALIGVDGRVAAWEAEPVVLRVLPGRRRGAGAGRLVAGARRRDAATARPPRRPGGGDRRRLLQHPGRGHRAGRRERRAADGLHPLDGHARRAVPAPAVRRAREHAGHEPPRIRRWIRLTGGMPSPTGKDPAAHMLLVRDAFPEVYERTYKFLNVLDYLNLRLTGRFVATYDSILTQLGDRQPRRRRRTLRLRPGARLRHRRRQVARDRQVHRGARAADRRRWPRRSGWRRARRSSPAPSTTPPQPSAPARSATTTSHLYIGTSSWMAAHVPFKKTDIFSALASVPCAVPGR